MKSVTFGNVEIKQIPSDPKGELVKVNANAKKRKRDESIKSNDDCKRCKIEDIITNIEMNPMFFASNSSF